MTRHRNSVAALLALGTGLLATVHAQAGSWQNNAPFGATLQGDLYSPTSPAASAGVLVAIHYCTGNKAKAHGWFDSLADKNGFYIIAPDAGKQCFDSSATRSGDRAAIVKMVDYVVTEKGADKSRVFAAGYSSGGCMTNTLLAIYPDVFAGGAAMPGFPAGGWPAGDTTCTKCGASPPSTDGKYWGDIARNAYSWNGTYPCSQQWVGGSDEYNFNGWLPAVVAQWQNLAGVDKGSTGSGAPSGWNRTVYKDASGNVRLETNVKPGQRHDLTGSGLASYVVSFLGLDQPTGACGNTSSGAGGTGGGPGGTGGATGGNSGNRDGGPDGTSGTRDGGRDTETGTGGDHGGTGGATAGGGGTTGSGGATGNGGKSGTDTTSSSGGSGTGGKPVSGGTTGSGDTSASGGSNSGGTLASGGSSGSGGSSSGSGSVDSTEASSGCTCAIGHGHPGGRATPALILLGLAMLIRRRRRGHCG